MPILALVLALSIRTADVVELERAGPYLVVREVFVNGHGPLRLLLDTGAEASAITERAARRAGIRPDHRVEQVTAAGEALVPAARSVAIRAGGLTVPGLAVLVGGIGLASCAAPGIDGVLGQDFLGMVNYTLDLRGKRLVLGSAAGDGERIAFERRDGRMVIRVALDGRGRRLVVDSGAPAVVVFGAPARLDAVLGTNAGSMGASVSVRTLALGARLRKRVVVAEVAGRGGAWDGLLPLAEFEAVYVDNGVGYVVFNPSI